MGFRMLRSAAAVLAVLLLAGCVPGEPVVTPEPDPDVTPVFASDEEALAAATEAYAKYLEVYNVVAQDGGTDPNRMASVVTLEWLENEIDAFEMFAERGQHQLGDATFDNAQFQMRSSEGAGHEEVLMYVCWDLSNVTFLEADDTITLPAQNRIPLELRLESGSSLPLPLLVAEVTPWSGAGIC